MRRIRLTVSYDGTNYVGYQYQPNGISVEEVLNKALTKLLEEEISVIGASRTDSHVHADGNIVVFDTESRMDADKFAFAINPFLPRDITVQESKEVPLSYHPRKVNSRKTYEYRILNRKIPIPKEREYSYFFYYDLDVEKMQRAANVILGEHDFSSFCSPRTDEPDKVRRIYRADFRKTGDIITFTITGNGFLYNMVRILVGTLIKIGSGLWPEEKMQEILDARDRSEAGPTAPPEGLTLKEIVEETELPPKVTEENPYWGYEIDYTKAPERGEVIVHHVSERDRESLFLRLTKQVSRNGCRYVYLKDETGFLKPGDSVSYFTFEEAEDGFLRTYDKKRETGLM